MPRILRHEYRHAIACVALLGASLAAFPAKADDPAAVLADATQPAAADQPLRVGVVSSGAISLGAYQAGVDWALLRYLRQQRRETGLAPRTAISHGRAMDLVTSTGASAGNINTLLSVATYCAKAPTPMVGNLFHDTWLPVGIDGLTSGYSDDDGLLSRGQISERAEKVAQALGQGFERCNVALGITLTPVVPEHSQFGTIFVDHERNTVLMRAVVGDAADGIELMRIAPADYRSCADVDELCKAEVRALHGAIGHELILPYESGTPPRLELANVIDAVQASAAVQFVFGAKAVSVCRADGVRGKACGDGTTQRTEYFSDGGFFDNTPLGLAFALGSVRHDVPPADEYIYIDPDNEDPKLALPAAAPTAKEHAAHRQSLASLGSLAGHLVSSARQYELATVSRYFEHYRDKVQSTVRRHPVVGTHLGHFAAFMARAFREYDYYVGVADGLYYVADRICSQDHSWGDGSKPAACRGAVLKELLDSFGIAHVAPPHNPAPMVVALLDRVLVREGERPIELPGFPVFDRETLPVLHAIDAAVLHAAATAEKKSDAADSLDAFLDDDGIGRILRHLRNHDLDDELKTCDTGAYCEEKEKAELHELVNDPSLRFRDLIELLLARQHQIESGDSASDKKLEPGMPRLVSSLQGLARQERLVSGLREWNGGSGPGGYSLWPYSVTVDAVRGGPDIAYRWFWPWCRWAGSVFQVGIWVRKEDTHSADWSVFAHGDLLLSLKTSRQSPLLPTIEAGVQARAPAETFDTFQVAPELGVGLIAEKLRISVVQYVVPLETAVFIGIGDLPGLLNLIF